MAGSFDSGSQTIEIRVSGWNADSSQPLTAVADPGFTGFLLLPIFKAFPVGLVLHSITDITLVDGSTQSKLICLGNIHFEGQVKAGMIIVEEQGTDVLIGMEFLKEFNLRLTIDGASGTISLAQTLNTTTGNRIAKRETIYAGIEALSKG